MLHGVEPATAAYHEDAMSWTVASEVVYDVRAALVLLSGVGMDGGLTMT